MLLRRALGLHLAKASAGTVVPRRVLRRGGVIEGAQKVLRRQELALSQSSTPFAPS